MKTPWGTGVSSQAFEVLAEVAGRFEPPEGLEAEDFLVLNSLGAAARPGPQPAEFRIAVRRDLPLLTLAVSKDTNRPAFFAAVSWSNQPALKIDAASTAAALVFAFPALATSEPLLAAQEMEVIRADAKVAELAALIRRRFAQPGDPFGEAAFRDAYGAAVDSVLASPQWAGVREAVRTARRLERTPPRLAAAGHFDLRLHEVDLNFLLMQPTGDIAVQLENVPFNPVDWVIVAREVDVEQAFPRGREDFRAVTCFGCGPIRLPYRFGFEQGRIVKADLLSKRIDLAGYLGQWLTGKLPGGGVDPIQFPARDGLYEIRAVGPGFAPEAEAVFAALHERRAYEEAIALNLIAAVLDALAGVIGYGAVEDTFWTELGERLYAEALKFAPTVNSAEDARRAFLRLLNGFLEALAQTATGRGAEALARVAGSLARFSHGVQTVLSTVSEIGAAAERFSGFVRITPLESAYVTVGNPFALEILDPEKTLGGSPGQEVSLTLQGGCLESGRPQDKVYFGDAGPPAELVSVGPCERVQVEGREVKQQRLTVRVPDALKDLAEGEVNLLVLASGRRGEGKFRLVKKPTVTGMSPLQGFLPNAAFFINGAPFAGTQVALEGFGFGLDDLFLFAGEVEGTNKSLSGGRVRLRVPAGAQTGPITIRREVAPSDVREGQSPTFVILGPPKLLGLAPETGPGGSLVELHVANAGTSLETIRIEFGGKPSPRVQFIAPERLQATVPAGLTPGLNPLAVTTPAGRDERGFLVQTGLQAGAQIRIGDYYGSPISLERALVLAAGIDVPEDDLDTDPASGFSTDPPYEEGDFVFPDEGAGADPRWRVGSNNADEILFAQLQGGTVPGPIRLPESNSFDTLARPADLRARAEITGSLVVEARGMKIDGLTIRDSPTHGVLVLGDHNLLNLTCISNQGAGLVLRGNNNLVLVSCISNQGDGLRIEGGQFNTVVVHAWGNGDNGVTLTDGAHGNAVYVGTQLGLPYAEPDYRAGNTGHGVALVGEATANYVTTMLRFIPGFPALSKIATLESNRLDGLRLEGAGVRNNRLNVSARNNGGNGLMLVAPQATELLGCTARNNARHGFAFDRAVATFARDCRSDGNLEGVVVTGVDGPETDLEIISAQDNREAAFRLAGPVRNLRLRGSSARAFIGLAVDGPEVELNQLEVQDTEARFAGAVIRNASRNRLTLSVLRAQRAQGVPAGFPIEWNGAGVVVAGGAGNLLLVGADRCAGDGLLLDNGASDNLIARGPKTFAGPRHFRSVCCPVSFRATTAACDLPGVPSATSSTT